MTVRIERAVAADAAAVAEVHRAGFTAGYAEALPEARQGTSGVGAVSGAWSGWLRRSRADTFVAREGRELIGFCTLHPLTEAGADSAVGEIPVIVVHPSHWRRGVGRLLVARAVEAASERRFSEVALWVLESNRRAVTFYESMGFRSDGGRRVFREGSAPLHEQRMTLSIDQGSKGPTE